MIPKVIHYCWFGEGKKPRLVRKCIASWKKYCPDYEIIEWNESNCDIELAPLFVQQAAERKKWGFVSDYFRVKIIYENGGIYLDTDVQLIKSLDGLLCNHAYWGMHNGLINSGHGFGAERGTSILKELMHIYEDVHFILSDGTCDLRPCTVRETPLFLKYGLIQDGTEQVIADEIHIYPKEYFDPGNWGTVFVYPTNNTVSIHHYASSWYEDDEKYRYIIRKAKDFIIHLPRYLLYKILGESRFHQFKQKIGQESRKSG